MVRAVGFDLDDTLAVTRRDRATLLREATAAVGGPSLTRAEYLAAHARNRTADSREAVFADLLSDADAAADPAELAAAYRRRVLDAIEPVAGVEGMLAALRERYRVGLLTNGPSEAQAGKVDALGWRDAFDAVLVSGDLPAGKPDERAFAALLDALDAPAGETAFVGDDPEEDVAGAAAAGLVPVHVLGPEESPHPAAAAGVRRSALVADLPDVLADL